MTVDGSNFGSSAADVRVHLKTGGGVYMSPATHHISQAGTATAGSSPVSCTIVSNSPAFGATQLGIAVTGLTNDNQGVLQAQVVVHGVRSALVQVAAVDASIPQVGPSSYSIGKHSSGNRIFLSVYQ